MKSILIVLALACAALPASAQGPVIKEAGAGVIAGDPIGGTAKLWFNQDYALDLGVGFSGSTVLWGDMLWHAWNLLPQPEEGKLGVYFGAGPRLETGDDPEFGVRTIAGVSWRLKRQPIEFFIEAGPVFVVNRGGGVDADAGLGVRLYLGSASR